MRIYLIRKVCKNYMEKKVSHDYYVYLKYNYFNCPQIITTIKHYSFVFKLTKRIKILFFNFILFLNFTILYWFCHISKWICHRHTHVPHPEFLCIKTTMRYHFTPTRIVRTKSQIMIILLKMWRNQNLITSCCIYFEKPPGTSSNDLT